jgi:hypothetical protein
LQGTPLQREKNEIFYFFENTLSTHVCQSKRTCKPCKRTLLIARATLNEQTSLQKKNLTMLGVDHYRREFRDLTTDNCTLTTVDLSLKSIDAAGAAAIAKALETNRTLTFLDLGYNDIGDAGAAAIAKALESNRTLTSINLRGNSIGDVGSAAIGKALETNRSLTSIYLYENSIGAAGAAAIAKALETNRSLTSIYLSENSIGAAGAAAIAKALESNCTLTSIDIHGNSIGDTGAEAMAKALESNRTLTSIDLLWNSIWDTGAAAMAAAVCKNPFSIVAFTPAQIVTVLCIHGGRRQRQSEGNPLPIDKLPYEMIRRILDCKVNEKQRVWDMRHTRMMALAK